MVQFTVPTRRRFNTFLFDLDGTLIESTSLIMASFRQTMRTHLGTVPDEAVWRAGFGTPLRPQLRKFARDDHHAALRLRYVTPNPYRLQPDHFMRSARERRGSGKGSRGVGALPDRPDRRRALRQRGRWGGARVPAVQRALVVTTCTRCRITDEGSVACELHNAFEEGSEVRPGQVGRSCGARQMSIRVLVVAGNLAVHGFSRVEREVLTKIATHDGLERVLGKIILKTVPIKYLDLKTIPLESCQENACVVPHDKAGFRVVVGAVAVQQYNEIVASVPKVGRCPVPAEHGSPPAEGLHNNVEVLSTRNPSRQLLYGGTIRRPLHPDLEPIHSCSTFQSAQYTVERHTLRCPDRRVSRHLQCPLPQKRPPRHRCVADLPVDYFGCLHHIDLCKRVCKEACDSVQLAPERKTPEADKPAPNGRRADSADPIQRIVEVIINFTARQRLGVVMQVPQAAFDGSSMLCLDQEILSVELQVSGQGWSDAQQCFSVPSICDHTHRPVPYPRHSRRIRGDALDGSHDSRRPYGRIAKKTENVIQRRIRRSGRFE